MVEKIQCHSCGYFFSPSKPHYNYCGYCYLHFILITECK